MKSTRKKSSLIERSVDDENFIHVVRMFPLMRMWAAGLQEGSVIDANALNMVHMPVEIAEAFIREWALIIGPLGDACRDVVAAMDGGIRGMTKFYKKGAE